MCQSVGLSPTHATPMPGWILYTMPASAFPPLVSPPAVLSPRSIHERDASVRNAAIHLITMATCVSDSTLTVPPCFHGPVRKLGVHRGDRIEVGEVERADADPST